MMSIPLIRVALKTRLEAVGGIRVHDEIPTAAAITGNATGAVISYTGTQYASSFDRTAERTFTVTLLAAKGSDRSAIDKLDSYCELSGVTSIAAALEGPIPGVASDVRVVSDSGVSNYTVGNGPEAVDYPGVEFTLEVMVP